MSSTLTVEPSELTRFATALLMAGGYTPSQAHDTADLLVWANLRGVDSHGVLRIPMYLDMVRAGAIVCGQEVETVREFGATAVLDAKRSPGATAMHAGVDKSIELAQHGIGWCSVSNMSHAGAIGYFARKVSEAGLIGMAMTASKPLMAYHGALGKAVSTNPLAIAIPRSDGRNPIVLDMSTAVGALGKVMAARDAGTDIPPGWAVDADGAETLDPARVDALLPMAGPKGSGLSLMIEMLCSVTVDNPLIAPALATGEVRGFNGVVAALDPRCFGEVADFYSNVDQLASAIESLEPSSGNDQVLMPGGRGDAEARRRASDGIPVEAGTAARLAGLATELGVPTPEALSPDPES